MRQVSPLLALLLPALVHADLVANGGFEIGGPQSAAGFSTHHFEGSYEYQVVTEGVHSGDRCLAITAPQAGWARWYTTDLFLLKGARYRLSCWVRSEAPADGSKPTGDVWLIGSGAELGLSFGLEPE